MKHISLAEILKRENIDKFIEINNIREKDPIIVFTVNARSQLGYFMKIDYDSIYFASRDGRIRL